MKINIATRIITGIILLIALATLFLGWYFIRLQTTTINRDLNRLGAAIASDLAVASEWDVLTGDSHSLTKTLVNLSAKENDIVFAEVTNAKGVVLATVGKRVVSSVKDFTAAINTMVLPYSEEHIGVVTSEKAHKEVIGAVRLQFSLHELIAETKRIKAASAGVVCLVALICFIIVFIEVRMIISLPLLKLMAGIKRLGRGDLSHAVRVNRRDEIGDLAQAFNRMAADLRATTVSRDSVDKIFSSMMDGVCVLSQDDVVKIVNQTACELVGCRREEMIGKKCRFLDTEFITRLAKEGKIVNYATQITAPDSRTIPVLLGGVAVTGPDGLNFILNISDISRLKEVQDALAAEKERLAVTLRSIGDGVIAVDNNAQIVMFNTMAEKITGWPCAQALNRPVFDIFRLREQTICGGADRSLDTVIKNAETLEHKSRILISKSGQERLILDSIAPIGDKANGIMGAVIVFHDITETSRVEEFLKIQKLESLSLFAGGIAHDFNNILTGILLNITAAKMKIDPDSQAYQILHEAETASIRARDLTRQLLTFSKGGEPIKEPTRIYGITIETVNFALSGSNVRADFDIAEGIWPVDVDKGQIAQVLQNLTINALQAMPKGGMISVKMENVTIDPVWGLPLPQGEKYIKITFKDQGTGIKPADLPKIFDPYFTTKVKGTGLGLAASHSIIKNHGGCILAESELAKGTTFYIYLPATDKHVMAGRDQDPTVYRGHGSILVMDDEDSVCWAVAGVLTSLGYAVKSVTDGEAAIAAFTEAKAQNRPFDLVILDLTVPGGMGGKETVVKLKEIAPDLKVVVSSGYSNDPIMANYKKYGFCDFIQKPYKAQNLGEVVTRVLRG